MDELTIISTDLDGTLLDHHDYQWSAALPALERCHELGIAVVFNTSKTAAEALSLRDQIGLSAPVIVENGSALVFSSDVVLPGGQTDQPDQPDLILSGAQQHLCFGAPRARILDMIGQWRARYGWQFSGFNDWDVDEIAAHTGLSASAARQAAAKQYSEPFVWHDSESALRELTRQAELAGLSVLQGGRFYHLQGQTDKARPLHWLRENLQSPWLRAVFGGDINNGAGTVKINLVCLGDNHNDVAMLNAADVAVCVRSPVAPYPNLQRDGVTIRTERYGPEGWNEAVLSLLSE